MRFKNLLVMAHRLSPSERTHLLQLDKSEIDFLGTLFSSGYDFLGTELDQNVALASVRDELDSILRGKKAFAGIAVLSR